MAMALRSPAAPDGEPPEDTAHASIMEAALKPDATPKDHTGTCRRNTQNATHPTRKRAGNPAMARNPSLWSSLRTRPQAVVLLWCLDQRERLALGADQGGHPAERGVERLTDDGGAECGSPGRRCVAVLHHEVDD